MSLLAGANQATNVEAVRDSLGGFSALESDAYQMKIKTAYLTTGSTGSKGMVLEFTGAGGNLNSRQYYVSGSSKGNKTFYVSKAGKEIYLPGYVICDDLIKACGIDGGLASPDLTIEKKYIKIYNKEAGGEVNTEVEMLMDLLDQTVVLGVLKCKSDKTALGGDNKYHPTGEFQVQNEIDKVFTPEGLTTLEVAAGITEATFLVGWTDKNKGVERDKSKGLPDSGNAGAPSLAATAAPVAKMFK